MTKTKYSAFREFAELWGAAGGAILVQFVAYIITDPSFDVTIMSGVVGAAFGWLIGWSVAILIMGKKPDSEAGKEGRIRNAQRRIAVGALAGVVFGYLVHLGVGVVVEKIAQKVTG